MKVLHPLWNQSSPRTNNCLAYSNYSYSGIGPKECTLNCQAQHGSFPVPPVHSLSGVDRVETGTKSRNCWETKETFADFPKCFSHQTWQVVRFPWAANRKEYQLAEFSSWCEGADSYTSSLLASNRRHLILLSHKNTRMSWVLVYMKGKLLATIARACFHQRNCGR